MTALIDRSGTRNGRLLVLNRVPKPMHRKAIYATFWRCRCDCGKEVVVESTLLRGIGQTTLSCGCIRFRNDKWIGQHIPGTMFRIKSLWSPGEGKMSRRYLCLCDCGNEFIISTSNLTQTVKGGRGATKSCGCYIKTITAERGREQRGELSPSWKSELTEEDRRHRRPQQHSSWRVQIFERDKYACVLCNHRGRGLEAHHLDSWSSCPNKRFLLDNGTTLCEDHHTKFHSLYGKRNNTRIQFEEYKLIVSVPGTVRSKENIRA